MPFPDLSLRDSAHRKYKNRPFWLKLSTGRTEADLLANELPAVGGWQPISFSILDDGQIKAADGLLPRHWEMPLQTFSVSASGQSLQYESAFIMADAATVATGGLLLEYLIFDQTQTVLDGQEGTVTLRFMEFDGAPYVT